jgi:hypothetical protein
VLDDLCEVLDWYLLRYDRNRAPAPEGRGDASKLALTGRTRRVVEQVNRNRSAMIEKVRTIWITGFLQQSLFQEIRILLGLSERPDAVARPLDLLVKRPDQGERPLPSGTQVVNVFASMDQSLLILGAPGSGKTTLLLELARDLLDRAEATRRTRFRSSSLSQPGPSRGNRWSNGSKTS